MPSWKSGHIGPEIVFRTANFEASTFWGPRLLTAAAKADATNGMDSVVG
jgi:hypothetical protein